MSTENFAKSLQEPVVALETEQATQAEQFGLMTGELEESELEAVSGGIFGWNIESDAFANRNVYRY